VFYVCSHVKNKTGPTYAIRSRSRSSR
jgi:hypothetical protein